MRIVYDSNIFVSALAIPGGQAERAVDLAVAGTVHLVISRAIIHEVVQVLGRKFSHEAERLARTAVFLADLGEVVRPKRRLSILKDEADNRILECAVEGIASAIVTGDRAMLDLKTYQDMRILSLRSFLSEIEAGGGV